VAFVVGLALVVVFGRLASDDDILVYEFTGDPGARAAELDRAVRFDFGFIAGFTLALGAVALFLRSRAFSGPVRTTMTVLLGMLGVAALSDVGEDVALLHHSGAWSAPFATLKFVMIVPVVLIVVGALLGHAGRAFFSWRFRRRSAAHTADGAHVFAGSRDDESPEQYRWRRAYWVPTVADPTTTDTTAVCLSGGGIRAGSVALGALQALSGSIDAKADSTSRNVLAETDYIVSVSGGGFLAGAFLQAAHSPPKSSIWPTGMSETLGADNPADIPDEPLPVDRSFKRGSVEYDRVRRHASYIADSPRELAVALAVVAKNMLLSLAVVFTPAVVLGVLLGVLYARLPISAVELDSAWSTTTSNTQPSLAVIGVTAALAVLSLAGANLAEAVSTKRWAMDLNTALTRVGQVAAAGAALVAVATFVIPWAMRAVWSGGGPTGAAGVAAPVSSVLVLNYVAVLAAILWRNRGSLAGIVGRLRGKPAAPKQAVPQGALQLLLVLVTLIVLVVSWLLTIAVVAAWAVRGASPHSPDGAQVVAVGAGAVVLLGVLSLFDVTSMSLHPFYRRRLAGAFAMRRVRLPDGQLRAVPYPPSESTELALFDEPRRTRLVWPVPADVTAAAAPKKSTAVTTPVFVFAAAATMSGEDKPASGQNAASYVFTADYVGSPDLGWLETDSLSRVVPTRILRDLTVQAAVSISGAAFASAMGRMARGYQTLLAVSGARLGSWLPNPRFLYQSHFEQDNPAWPHGLPNFRGISYLAREVFGLHSGRGRLVQVTDGGHYENLGLVEALRRRCTTIVAVDASGDAPPSLTTFAEAMRLAEAELGIRFTVDEEASPTRLVPGTADAVTTAGVTEDLQRRLASSSIVRVGFTYPQSAGGGSGTLILAKAVLTADLPPWLLTYADNHPVFPHDATSDQWFNEGQFAAYTELGRHLGSRAAEALP
jgi:heme/copper-type cytochrome/quinol oxidase subunit 2